MLMYDEHEAALRVQSYVLTIFLSFVRRRHSPR